MISDGYDQFYANRLWGLLPAIYRTSDASGALWELVNRIGAQAAVVRRSIDRLGENQSIETCDDWVIPYIGDLVATRLVSCLPPPSQREDVAKTIYYRRRAGTVGLLEELGADIAQRDARVVEFFRRLGRTRHQFDPPIRGGAPGQAPLAVAEGLIGPYSGTPAGGFADLRNALGANNTGTAFDEFAHTADLRRGCTTTGWYNISHLGVFVWWLRSFQIADATPVSNGAAQPCFTFDPTGRDLQLFAPSLRDAASFGENWVSPDEWQLPVPIGPSLWRAEAVNLYLLSGAGAFSVGLGTGPSSQTLAPSQLRIHPDTGRFSFVQGVPSGVLTSTYYFGFPSQIGAGAFDTSLLGTLTALPVLVKISGGVHGLANALPGLTPAAVSTMFEITDSATYDVPATTLDVQADLTLAVSADGMRPVLRPIAANAAANSTWTLNGHPTTSATQKTEIVLQGFHLQGADIVVTGDFDTVTLRMVTLDPGTSGADLTPAALFRTSVDNRPLRPGTLYIDGSVTNLILERCITGPIRTRNGGVVETLTATDSIIQSVPTHMVLNGPIPASAQIFDVADLVGCWINKTDPLAAQVYNALPATSQAALKSYVIGQTPSTTLAGIITGVLGTLNQQQAEAAWPLALADLALGFSAGSISLARCTVMGPTVTHRLAASESILDSLARVDDPQHGCVRFSATVTGSNLHAPYRCVTVPPGAALFQTRLFGRAEYALPRPDADNTILTPSSGGTILGGAQNGAEMGACGNEVIALKKRGLAIKFQEFMPIGQAPVWIDVD